MAGMQFDQESLYHTSMMMDPSEFERGLDQWMQHTFQQQADMSQVGMPPPAEMSGPGAQQRAPGSALTPQAIQALNTKPQSAQAHFAPSGGVPGHGGGNIQFSSNAPAVAPGGQAGPKRSMADIMYGRR